MTRTSPVVSFGLYALEVKQDSSPSCPDAQAFSKVADLKTDNATALPYASYEPDFWLLDGSYKFLPTNAATVHVGLMSSSMSDASGNFAVPPVLTIDFSTVHTSDGLTIKFSQYTGDYASSVTVAYYDAVGALIRSDAYAPSSWELVTGVGATGFKQICITFAGTSRPYRYLRVAGVDYGTLIYFTGSQIKAASVVEETDMLSGEARFNTCELRLYSADGAFSIINPGGVYQYLQQRQPVAVHETVDNQSILMGQFYTDTWENKSETQIEFHCIDLLGTLDTITYVGDLWTGSNIEDVVDAILGPINVPYDLDSNLYGAQIKGWIPICSYREALQQIALAVGAYLDCSRSASLKIYQMPDLATAAAGVTITKARKGQNQVLGLKPLVTGVEVTGHNYVSATTSKQVYNGTLAAGTFTVEFSEPMHNLSVSGATIASSGANYAVLTVSSPGTVTLSGQTYLDTKPKFSVAMPGLAAGTKPNIKRVENATLVNADNGQATAQRIYDYYQNRLLQKLRMYAPTDVQSADVVLVDTLYSQQIKAIVEKMSIDLFGGMVADIELTGRVNA